MRKAIKRSLSMLFVVTLLGSMFAIPVLAYSHSAYWHSRPTASKTAYITTYTQKYSDKVDGKSDGKIAVYEDEALKRKVDVKKHYIACDNDACHIIKISTKYDSVQVRYILSSGKWSDPVWVPASVFVNGKSLNDWHREAYPPLYVDESYSVYMRSDGKKEIGWVFREDEDDTDYIWILDGTEKGDYVQVIYRVTVGSEKNTYKMGWMKQASAEQFVPDP